MTMTLSVVRSSPEEFFSEALGEAMQKERVAVSANTHHYVVQLLVRQVDRGYNPDETLSDRFARASHAKPVDRNRILREVGDMAVVSNGLWWGHQYRPLRPSHATLHMNLGRLAYRSVGGVPYDELATNISGVVDALIRLGIDHSLNTARDVLRLYILWAETHSPHAARALSEQGLMVMPLSTQARS